MKPSNDSCGQNLTDAAIKHAAITTGIPAVICLFLNLVGLTSALIFVCTKKNTFFLKTLCVFVSLGHDVCRWILLSLPGVYLA